MFNKCCNCGQICCCCNKYETSGIPGEFQGAAGYQGTGLQGPAGPRGPRGFQGPQGPAGPAGIRGAQGPAGPAGMQGEQGPAGTDGVTPVVTVAGTITGDPGTQASVIETYAPTGCDLLFTIPAGIQGPAGAQGPQGEMGPQGPAGAQGQPGPAGAQGVPGPAGAQGPQGEMGPQGPAGAQGVPGPAGAQGSQGVPGPAGAQGQAGPAGVQGEPGPAGAQGSQGVPGPAGAQGEQGPQGIPGPAGAQGEQGPQGKPGPAAAMIPFSATKHGTYIGCNENGKPIMVAFSGFAPAYSQSIYLNEGEWDAGTIIIRESEEYCASFVMTYDAVLKKIYTVFSPASEFSFEGGGSIYPFACLAVADSDQLVFRILQNTIVRSAPYNSGIEYSMNSLRRTAALDLNVAIPEGSLVAIVFGIMGEGLTQECEESFLLSGGLYLE